LSPFLGARGEGEKMKKRLVRVFLGILRRRREEKDCAAT
jgi:hypothetical protein